MRGSLHTYGLHLPHGSLILPVLIRLGGSLISHGLITVDGSLFTCGLLK